MVITSPPYLNCLKYCEIVFDLLCGSGTFLLAGKGWFTSLARV